MAEMNVVVLVKQVPDPASIKLSEEGTLLRDGVPSVIDPFGKMALRLAISLKKKHDVHITAITMGPMQASDVLRKCLEHGCDKAILLSDRKFAGSDTWATSYTLSKCIERINPDLIICGMQATDGDTAQVPAELSVLLDYNMYSNVTDLSDNLRVTQAYEREIRTSQMKTPAVISVSRYNGNAPELSSMTDFLRARSMDIEILDAEALGLPYDKIGLRGSKTKVVKTFTPEIRKIETVYHDGSDPSNAVKILKEELNE